MILKRTLAVILVMGFCAVAIFPASLKPPKQTYALRFSDRRIAAAPLKTALNLGGTYTLEAWIIPEASLTGIILGRMCDPAYEDPSRSYVLEFTGGKNLTFSRSTGKAGSMKTVFAAFDRSLNAWTHVAATLEKNAMKIFINGVEAANGKCSGPTANKKVPFAIGNGAASDGKQTNQGFRGAIAQVRIWKRALTAAELKAQAVKYLTGYEAGLAAYWPLDDGPGQKIRDLGPSKVDMTLPNKIIDWVYQDPLWARTAVLRSSPHFSVESFTAPSNLSDGRLFDFDSDNDPDFVGTNFIWPPGPASLMAFRNDGKGRFANATSQVLVQSHSTWHPRDFALADFTGDKLLDMFIADHGRDDGPACGAQNQILIQAADGRVVDETSSRLPPHSDFSHSVAVGDIEGDGDIDIYVGNISGGDSGPYFLINNGAGFFTEDKTRIPGPITARQVKYTSACLLDYDKDGDNDLILGRHGSPGLQDDILLNNGTGRFSYAPATAMPPRYGGFNWETIEISPADFNNDGWTDLLMGTELNYKKSGIQLLLNNGNGTFRDATSQIPQSQPNFDCWIIWLVPADIDGDGWTDIIMVGAGQECRLFLNKGNARFIDGTDLLPVTAWDSFNSLSFSSIHPGDVDGDGDLDLFLCRGAQDFFVVKNLRINKAAAGR